MPDMERKTNEHIIWFTILGLETEIGGGKFMGGVG